VTDVTMDASALAREPGPILKRHVTAAVIGNALEFYDFVTYSYFAVQIGHAFFPSKVPFVSLMLSLATFGAGFILRPVGAVLIGRYADRVGRKPAMLFSLILMGVSILGLVATPSYAMIGVAAPTLALFWRLIQGFALGGEVGPTTAFLVEAAPPARRGFYTAFQGISQSVAALSGGLVGVILANLAGPQALESWGWRVALLLGAVVLPFGYWLRRTLPETLHRHADQLESHPADARVRSHMRIILIGLGIIASGTVSTYVLGFMTTYAITTLHMPAQIALGSSVAGGLCSIVGGLIGGIVCDRIGRRPMLIWPRIVFMMVIIPAFQFVIHHHDAVALLAAVGLMGGISSLGGAALYAALTESMHKNLRGAGVGLIYASAVAVFGGTTQPIIAWLTHLTGNPLAPAWYMLGFSFVGLIASVLLRESAPARLALQRA
jgi:MFS transporter, MHS family, citrate/tricarballylate:H+ symporter